jgi:hypothetical protein
LAPIAGLIGGETRSERSWRVGADGEVRTAERLAKHLRESGVVILNDRRISGSRANIDHIAVGTGGVTVIDSKNYSGKVRVARGRLWVKDRNRTSLVESVLGQVELVRAALLATLFDGVSVEAALAWSNVDGLPLFGSLQLRGVLIDGTRKVAKLAGRPGTLSDQEVDDLTRLLAASFPAA